MKNWLKLVIAIAAALAAIAAGVLVVLKYKEQIAAFAKKTGEKVRSRCPICGCDDEQAEDFEDFEDVE